MIADANSVNDNHPDESALPAPRFDGRAAARAQPVEPIHFNGEPVHKSIGAQLRNRFPRLTGQIGAQSRTLAFVVIIGLITGGLGGVLLVNAARTSEPEPVAEAPTDPGSAISVVEYQQLDAFAAGLERATPTVTRTRRFRGRAASNKPRAYRVAIIR